MSYKRPYYRIGIILTLACLAIQANLALPLLSGINVIESLGRDLEPSYITPLAECQFEYGHREREEEIVLNAFFSLCTLLHPSLLTFSFWGIPGSGNFEIASDYRQDIKRLIPSHFHGSRYKSVISSS